MAGTATPPIIVGGSSQRPHSANVYKPAGVKHIQTGIPWVDGGSYVVPSKVDLSLPIRGFRVKLRGRFTIGGANFTNVNPEGLLNLIANLKIEGTNSRQGGNITLWDLDFATLFSIQHLFQRHASLFQINGTEVATPATPYPAGYATVNTGNYDYKIVIDLPAHPFKAGGGIRGGYLIRQEEWADSLAISFKFGSQLGAGADGSIGLAAGGSTTAHTGYGSGAGTPTVDVSVLPVQMGHLRNKVLPGIVTRTQRPLTTILQGAGGNVTLLQLQKQRTSRIYLKTGTVTGLAPAFKTLDDTNVTALGLQTGGSNRNVKPREDIDLYKMNQAADYERPAIQGYTCLDFLESGNPDSAYPAHNQKVVGTGATFELVGDVAGEANGYGLVIQEQITHLHSGELYNF